MNLVPHQRKILALELTRKRASGDPERLGKAMLGAQVDLNPHQLDAALFALESPLSRGVILADEVGLGKTIEAGLVLTQFLSEEKKRILIIAPANLRKQWSGELQEKFHLKSEIIEGKNFNSIQKSGIHNPFNNEKVVIVSYQFAKAKAFEISQISWDLVVLDEAHRLRNVYKESNVIANTIKESLRSRFKLLLTATPLQNSLSELYGLVSIIDEQTFGDFDSFSQQFLRIQSEEQLQLLKNRIEGICKRTLRKQVLEYIKYTKRIPITKEFIPNADEDRLHEWISAYLQRENLAALPKSQRKLMTLILRKLLASSTYAIAGTLQALVDRLEKKLGVSDTSLDLEIEKLIADDFEEYEEIKEEWSDFQTQKSIPENHLLVESAEDLRAEIKELKEYLALANNIQANSKAEVLLTGLGQAFSEMERLGGAKKAVIFTESRRTQNYLFDFLSINGYANQILLFNGSNNDDTSKKIFQSWMEKYKGTDKISGSKTADIRAALVEEFKEKRQILIATEAAAEGINLQFCSIVVNYDLPWNPQRIEQRIGRCHRYGQNFDVVVVNFLNKKNLADVRVYELLSEKFQLFSGVFGASDEVLGNVETGVDFEKRIAEIFQSCRTKEEIQDAFDKLQSELQSDINERIKETREKLLTNFDEIVQEKLKIRMEESEILFDRQTKLLWILTKDAIHKHGKTNDLDLSFRLDSNPFLSLPIQLGHYRMGKSLFQENSFHSNHPLAKKILEAAVNESIPEDGILKFTLSKDRIDQSYANIKNKQGDILATLWTLDSFEKEEVLLITILWEDGSTLDNEQAIRLFSRSCQWKPYVEKDLNSRTTKLEEIHSNKKNQTLINRDLRNQDLFTKEYEKLDAWADDKRLSLQKELKSFDEEIKIRKKQAKDAGNLTDRLKLERERKEIEKRRDEAWKSFEMARRSIDEEKEKFLEEMEKKAKFVTDETVLFYGKIQIV
ncbi:DEAD/DEAH box helicase [Leptospira congkakensis]|uniref:DEAD/DEAH box helicase n=1 Tax=Leptospira congkakensis TaxID=2484932 RepID=A0A4Z1AFF4_9LEPT|nr:SNF2-related protein [Leptospira congkakensis]TGL86896.1 DEAD/DEAH box helicase [Leptospira congkakensis]TGL93560.1 DEAD/DEAH box helicase [Leptospira congkakensis]TGL95032.1 DEAD/DEAH box helicase [Leptospira congkakensis]